MPKFPLERFLAAQTPIFPVVVAELAHGKKETHWMWYVFPQLKGLGHSENATIYGLDGIAEAQAYATHPILGRRLRACSEIVLTHQSKPAAEIFGIVDAGKLRSCATLFATARPESPLFSALLHTFFGDSRCPLTDEALAERQT